MRLALAAAAVAIVSCFSACDSGSSASLPDPGPSTGLDTTAPIAGLSPVEDATLCDWVAGRLGGYGRTRTCGDAKVSSPATQAACVSDFESLTTGCPITVGDLQSCVNASLAGPCPSGSLPADCFNLIGDGLSSSCQ